MKDTICKDIVDKIIDFVDAELDNKTVEKLEKHKAQCPECNEFVLTYKIMLDLCGQLKKKKFVTPEIRQRLKECLRDSLQND